MLAVKQAQKTNKIYNYDLCNKKKKTKKMWDWCPLYGNNNKSKGTKAPVWKRNLLFLFFLNNIHMYKCKL